MTIDTTDAAPPPWLLNAYAEIGVAEVSGGASNSRIVDYARAVGHGELTDDDVPWCATFVGACLERSGVSSTKSLRARSYLSWGMDAPAPAPAGTIAVFSRGPDPNAGHVGFCLADLGQRLVILGGNQSDAVTVELMPRTRLLSLRWPLQDLPAAQKPELSPSSPSKTLFDHCLAHVLKIEGGYGDDPYDPGGPTNLGITLATLAAWRKQPLDDSTRPALLTALKAVTPADAAPIYAARYWTPSRAAELPPALALMHFDAAVNHGVTGAARLLQTALDVDIDGEIGPITLGAANDGDVTQTLADYADARRARYRALPHFWRFGRGWLARIDATLAAARSLPAFPQPANPRKDTSMSSASESDTSTTTETDPKWWGHSLTIWGTLITALSTVLPAIGPLFGLDITAELVRQLGTAIAQAVEAIGGVVGIALTILGRMRAVQPLTRRPFAIKL